jgi:hypothetical protein
MVRETRYLSEAKGSNKLAELDLYLRKFSLRTPVLEVLDSDPIRLLLAQNLAGRTALPPADALPDLVAGALAERDFKTATQFLERERAENLASPNDIYLLTYLYCLTDQVDKAELLAAETATSQKDWFVTWLWGKLQAEFGFRPPR